MAAAEMDHFETLETALTERGHEIFAVMDPFVRALDNYHASTTPSTWLESLVKAYVGDGIACRLLSRDRALPPGGMSRKSSRTCCPRRATRSSWCSR